MKFIDLDTWKRASHYQFYGAFEKPHYSITTQVSVDVLYAFCKKHGIQFYPAYLYASQLAVHEVEEFRQRIVDGKPAVFDRVHAAPTVPMPDETFRFSVMQMKEKWSEFLVEFQEGTARAQKAAKLNPDYKGLDVIYYSAIPWISFSGITNPIPFRESSVPHITFGKTFEQDQKMMMPVGVEVNHALVDGVHIAKYLEHFAYFLSAPEKWIKL